MVGQIRHENGQIILDGYPAGSGVHGIDGPAANEFLRLSVLGCDLRNSVEWLALIPKDVGHFAPKRQKVFEGLADAALVAFFRCFDANHSLKSLQPGQFFTLEQLDMFERLRVIRNKIVAHDERLFGGVSSLIVRNKDFIAIEAVTLQAVFPFIALPELDCLRQISNIAFNLICLKRELLGSQIVANYNNTPIDERINAPAYTIKIESKEYPTRNKHKSRS